MSRKDTLFVPLFCTPLRKWSIICAGRFRLRRNKQLTPPTGGEAKRNNIVSNFTMWQCKVANTIYYLLTYHLQVDAGFRLKRSRRAEESGHRITLSFDIPCSIRLWRIPCHFELVRGFHYRLAPCTAGGCLYISPPDFTLSEAEWVTLLFTEPRP